MQLPRPGMFAMARNRRGVIVAVEPFDGEDGRLHLVHVDYKDDHLPREEQLVWEVEVGDPTEPRATVLPPNALPDPAHGPMPAGDFDALVRAARWTATMPFVDPDDAGPLDRLPVSSPFHGAVEVDDYQLIPLLKALRMPRVNLLIADDVGIGKTIEAGLILAELLIRRRVQRVLILTPASLRLQWRDEMKEKFSLPFDLVDRAETQALQRRLGMDANPWRAFNRIITSYHYLRQADVLEQFRAACRVPEGSPHLPWDLLIVDECHNLMPSPFGEDSDLTKMLRFIAPYFEHRLFLSATPHNGHTRSFTGLLELLDPVRFSATDELKGAQRSRVEQVVVRRLKSEINARTNPPKFCTRLEPRALPLALSPEETALTEAYDDFRAAMRSWIAAGDRKRRRAGSFALEILGKRLLSCPVAFAESWRRCKEGLAETAEASDAEVDSARKSVERETGDDREAQEQEATAAGVVGAWLKHAAPHMQSQMKAIDDALAGLGLDASTGDGGDPDPVADARLAALVSLIDQCLRADGHWRDDERLVVFTEYKTTLDYLARRLRERYEPERILTLYGGMDEQERDDVKQAFNDPAADVRVLLGTDAASEGLNLQRTARYLLHYDLPWNPSKVEQRNGRLDRHGQARDVQVFHFVADTDDDMRFLAHVMRKANDIREDLGSVNELFDEAMHRRLVEGEAMERVTHDLDERLQRNRARASIEADDTVTDDMAAAEQLSALADELDLDPGSLRETLEAALAVHAGRPQLVPASECDAPGTWRLVHPDLPGWIEVVDESLRTSSGRDGRGPLRRLAFDSEPFIEHVGERTVFNPRPDVAMMHLSHPMLQKAFSVLSRRRFPGTGEEVSRWTVRTGRVPGDADALVLLFLEEIAVNELRETFHDWVRTVVLPVGGGHVGEPLPHVAAVELRDAAPATDGALLDHAADLFDDVTPELRRFISTHAARLTEILQAELATAGERARAEAREKYRSRSGEVSALIKETTIAKLEREIARLEDERAQGALFNEESRLEDLARSIEEKQAEVERRKRHYEEVREQLEQEHERLTRRLLPRRYAMAGDVQVFPVGVEIRLPAQGAAR
ncbi:MAG TPA: DISARM system SNF2-like helicase DrmD [Thermoleophilia bacterium]|nr:DISARM system SNF2-like helicase DrmD [Thermoleophilia bacterium]